MKNRIDLLYISNSPRIASVAEEAGIDYLFIDLEIRGKVERQGGLDTVISKHTFEDILKVRPFLKKTKLLVRINPIYEGTKREIELAIKNGADAIMLPMFETKDEVDEFVKIVDGRAEIILLLETKNAVRNLNDILEIPGINRIHIGLNDLHLQLHKKFMFELLSDGTVDSIIGTIKKKRPDLKYGFGGVGRIGEGMLPATNILAFHYEVKSSSVILSRQFCDLKKTTESEARELILAGVKALRSYYDSLQNMDAEFFADNRKSIKRVIHSIVGE